MRSAQPTRSPRPPRSSGQRSPLNTPDTAVSLPPPPPPRAPTDSLVSNIRTICDELWQEARRSGCSRDEPVAELQTVCFMMFLLGLADRLETGDGQERTQWQWGLTGDNVELITVSIAALPVPMQTALFCNYLGYDNGDSEIQEALSGENGP